MKQFGFQWHPEALFFAAAFGSHQQHHGAFRLGHVLYAIYDGKSELIDQPTRSVVHDRNGVVIGQ